MEFENYCRKVGSKYPSQTEVSSPAGATSPAGVFSQSISPERILLRGH